MDVNFPPAEQLLIVSPHLDDAVFSCGTLMAMRPGVTVLTVFAGIPSAPGIVTEWDRISGFGDAVEAMQSRREEDRQALGVLAAHPLWLDFLDGQYRPLDAEREVSAALKDIIDKLEPQQIFIPAGLFHTDHEAVHRALMAVYRNWPENSWWLYEEPLYRRVPGLLQRRLSALLADGRCATPRSLFDSAATELKRAAIRCYPSQLRALKQRVGAVDDLLDIEGYWHLSDSPVHNGEHG